MWQEGKWAEPDQTGPDNLKLWSNASLEAAGQGVFGFLMADPCHEGHCLAPVHSGAGAC